MELQRLRNFDRLMRGMQDIKTIMEFLVDVDPKEKNLIVSGINTLLLRGNEETLGRAYRELQYNYPVFSDKLNNLNSLHQLLSEDFKIANASPKRKQPFSPRAPIFPSPQKKARNFPPPSSADEASTSTGEKNLPKQVDISNPQQTDLISTTQKTATNIPAVNLSKGVEEIILGNAGLSQEDLECAIDEMDNEKTPSNSQESTVSIE